MSASDAHRSALPLFLFAAGTLAAAAVFLTPSWSPNAVAAGSTPAASAQQPDPAPDAVPDRVLDVLGGRDVVATIEADTFDGSLGPWRTDDGALEDGTVVLRGSPSSPVVVDVPSESGEAWALVLRLTYQGSGRVLRVAFDRGLPGTDEYRSWGVVVSGGALGSSVYEGAEEQGGDPVAAAPAGTGLWLVLARQDGEFLAAAAPVSQSAEPVGIIREAAWPTDGWAPVVVGYGGTVTIAEAYLLVPAWSVP
ncbi:MAG: hypothetical protein KQH83_05935 [Actinobacteria bacterium]|nr:hypothetical protein [Actinomycetota bacterium]